MSKINSLKIQNIIRAQRDTNDIDIAIASKTKTNFVVPLILLIGKWDENADDRQTHDSKKHCLSNRY
jgi:hypothetical protein